MKTYETIEWVRNVVKDINHSGETFIGHLLGTYHILKMWGQREELCLAGLCHSLYETSVFKNDALRDKVTREELADRIGPEAEYVVYLFCYMPSRGRSIMENRYELPPQLHEDLLKLDFANYIEQIDRIGDSSNEEKITQFRRYVQSIQIYDKKFSPDCPWSTV